MRDAINPPASEVPPSLPRLAASFYAACVPIFIQPQHALYPLLTRYVLGKATADFEDVPLFYKLMSGPKNDEE